VQSTYELAYSTRRQMRDASSDCFAIEHAKNVTKHAKNVTKFGDRFDKRFARIFLNEGFWSAVYWLLFLVASISKPVLPKMSACRFRLP
jgi:hypothetical protein